MGLFTRLFTRTGQKGKMVNSGRARLCSNYKADKIEQDLRAFMLQRVYRVPNKQWLQVYDQYTDDRAQQDLNACAAGRPLKWSHKVVRYDKLGLKTPDAAVKYALKKYHGFSKSDLANYNQVKNQIPYGRFSALRNIKRDRTGKAARYKFMPKLGIIRNTKSGKLMAPLQHSAPRSNYKYVPSSHPELRQAGLGPYTKNQKKGYVQNATPRHAEFAEYLKKVGNNNNRRAGAYHPGGYSNNNRRAGYPPPAVAGYPAVHYASAATRQYHNAGRQYPVVLHHAAPASAPRMTQAHSFLATAGNWFPAQPGNTAAWHTKGQNVYRREGNRYVKNVLQTAEYRAQLRKAKEQYPGAMGKANSVRVAAAGASPMQRAASSSKSMNLMPSRTMSSMTTGNLKRMMSTKPSRAASAPARTLGQRTRSNTNVRQVLPPSPFA